MIKHIHRASLAIALLMLLHWAIFGTFHPEWILFSVPLFTSSVSIACGIIMICNERGGEIFLPPLDYLTYGTAALIWSFFIMAWAHDIFGMGQIAYWLGIVLPWAMFVGPWLAFRRHKSTPMVIDAALLITATLLGYAAKTSVRNLPSVGELATGGYLILPGFIAVIAYILYRLKKAGIPELPVALAIGTLLVFLAPELVR